MYPTEVDSEQTDTEGTRVRKVENLQHQRLSKFSYLQKHNILKLLITNTKFSVLNTGQYLLNPWREMFEMLEGLDPSLE